MILHHFASVTFAFCNKTNCHYHLYHILSHSHIMAVIHRMFICCSTSLFS